MTDSAPPKAKSAIVIGAGLAGANIAERLAMRGWRVDVIDSAGAPGQGASGNPAGIVLPQVARDDALAARFSRACFLYLLDFLHAFPDLDWHACGVLQIARDAEHEAIQQAAIKALGLPESFATFMPRDTAEQLVGQPLAYGGWWFPQGGWVAPQQLCSALLAHHPAFVRCHFNTSVARVEHVRSTWSAFTFDGRIIASAEHLILANAHSANTLLDYPLPLKSIRGQISYLPASALPSLPFVLCRNGYVTPACEGRVSFGASFINDDLGLELRANEHQENLERLREILPQVQLDPSTADTNAMGGRVALRTATPDRLPLVGKIAAINEPTPRSPNLRNLPRHNNLHGLLGLSARGIVWAPLAAEHLACSMNHETSPLSPEIADAIDAGRFFLKDLRQR